MSNLLLGFPRTNCGATANSNCSTVNSPSMAQGSMGSGRKKMNVEDADLSCVVHVAIYVSIGQPRNRL
jgi:hypothetical protein